MIKNYIKVAFRNLFKNRVYATINIVGLALGLMVSILVFLYVQDETSYEKHISDYERIYRTGIVADLMGQKIDAPISPSPMANSLRTEFTEIEMATRSRPIRQEILLRHEQNRIYIELGARADSCFFKIFDYEFIYGDPNTALTENNGIVISEETAQKFFGNENPMGKILNYDDRRDMIVRGVYKKPLGKGHFEYDFVIAENGIRNVWMSNNFFTYFKLREGHDSEVFLQTMTDRYMNYIAPEVEAFLKMTVEEFFAQNNSFAYDLQAIKDIHLHSHRDWEIKQNGNVIYIYIFVGIAFLVILIAGINFMNLATARSAKRAKEVGIRKVTGATRGVLITQFLTEAIIQSFIALFLSFVILELFLPGFNNIMDTDLKLLNDHFGKTLGFSLIIMIVYGLFSGSYPAFFLSGFQPVRVLKGDMTKTKSGAFLRKSLVVVQFTASIILIIGMSIILKQINFMHNKNLGFNGEQVLVVPIQTDKVAHNFESYKNIFLKNSNVQSVSRSTYLPGDTPNQNMYSIEGDVETIPLWNLEVDYDFQNTLKLEIAEGRYFSREKDSDSTICFIVNETAVESFNIENPIGCRMSVITGPGQKVWGNIVGVVKDFHIEGFNQPIKPMVLTVNPNLWYASIRISSENMPETIDYIEQKWNEIEPSHPFRYRFLDEKFGALFKQQVNFGKMFLYLTILAIIIAAMGLYGLTSYTAEQKTKELGIRKVLGASVTQLMTMLTKDFIKLVLLANIFAWPIAFLLAKEWLKRFSYQIEMPLLPYVLATLAAVVIAVLTVSYQAYQASSSDPVEALKYE